MRAAEEHRRIAAGFTRRVIGVAPGGWEAPSPVAGWTARDVVRHLLDWLPPFLESGSGIRIGEVPSVDEDPVTAWAAHTRDVQAILDDADLAAATFSHPRIGEMRLDVAIDRFYTSDVFMHSWDLARATGQDDRLDPVKCAELLAGMEPMEEVIRASGQFGERVEVPADADVQTRLLGFIGRDPFS